MFSKIFKKIQRNIFFSGKKKKIQNSQANKNRQSSFFDTKPKSWIFRKRKKNPISWADLRKNLFQFVKTQQLFVFFWGFTVCITIWIFLLVWPLLKINEILVEETGNIININQIYDNIDYIRWSNLLFVNTQELSQRIKKNQNTIQDIRFNKNFPSTLNMDIISFQAIFQTEWYLIVENWALVSREDVNEILPFLKISEDLYERALFNKRLSRIDLTNILLLQKELTRNILGFVPKTLYYLPVEQELLIENSIWNIFIFDLASDIDRQVKWLAIFSKEEGNVNEKKYIYIDVRIPQKLFLCDYESEFSCVKNLKNIYGDSIFENFPEDVSPPVQ